jgi:hypothetical protein
VKRRRRSFLDFLSPQVAERLREEARRELERDELVRMMRDAPGVQPPGTRLVRRGRRLRQVSDA